MTQRKRVGFKHYDEPSVENNIESTTPENTSTVPATSEHSEKNSVVLSPAQAELLETIKNLSEIITEKSFADFADEQRIAFVSELMQLVALNTELTMKTVLLLQK